MKRLLISTTSLFAILCSPNAFADDAPAASPDVAGPSVDEIVVTATRTPQPLYKVGSSITVLNQAAIESSQAVVVTDLLSQTPGVSYSRNGGVGGTTALRIRGAETDQTVVVIDGVKVNDPSSPGGGYNAADLLTGDIDRIEILRGAQSTLWGSQAIGGVVNIVTTAPTKPFEASGNVEGGSLGTGYGHLGVGGADGRLEWRLAGSYYVTDGVSAFAAGKERDGYQNEGLSGRVRYDVMDNVSIDLRGLYTHAHSQYDGFPAPAFSFADTAEYSKTNQYVGYAGLNFDLFNGRFKNRVAYGYTDIERDNFNPDQPVTIDTFESVGRNERIEYQGSLSIAQGWDAVIGAEHERSSFRTASPSNFDPNPTPALASVGISSGYAQLQGEVIKGLTLTGGVRYDDHDTFGGRALGQLAAAWAVNDQGTVLRASFGQGFKAPTLYQLYSDYGNTGLKPEEANSWDGGVEQHLMGDTIVVSAIGFYRATKNQIDFVNCPGANPLCTVGKFGVYDNIVSTHADGAELAGSAKLGALTLQANYTYTDTENTSPGGSNYGKDLARRPKHEANFWASYAWPMDVSTGVVVRYVGNAFDNAANTVVLHNYALVDLHAAWQINQTVEVYGRVENLFNQIYVTTSNNGSPRRGAFGGIRAKF